MLNNFCVMRTNLNFLSITVVSLLLNSERPHKTSLANSQAKTYKTKHFLGRLSLFEIDYYSSSQLRTMCTWKQHIIATSASFICYPLA